MFYAYLYVGAAVIGAILLTLGIMKEFNMLGDDDSANTPDEVTIRITVEDETTEVSPTGNIVQQSSEPAGTSRACPTEEEEAFVALTSSSSEAEPK